MKTIDFDITAGSPFPRSGVVCLRDEAGRAVGDDFRHTSATDDSKPWHAVIGELIRASPMAVSGYLVGRIKGGRSVTYSFEITEEDE